jgi:hypothetical protein
LGPTFKISRALLENWELWDRFWQKGNKPRPRKTNYKSQQMLYGHLVPLLTTHVATYLVTSNYSYFDVLRHYPRLFRNNILLPKGRNVSKTIFAVQFSLNLEYYKSTGQGPSLWLKHVVKIKCEKKSYCLSYWRVCLQTLFSFCWTFIMYLKKNFYFSAHTGETVVNYGFIVNILWT